MIWLAAALIFGGQDVVASQRQLLSEDRCYRELIINGVRVVEYKGDRACIGFQPPREFSGIWVNHFEGSEFIEGGTSLADVPRGARERVWLDMENSKWASDDWRREYGHVYRVRFSGRAALDMHRKPGFAPNRTEPPGYGHFGMSNGLVMVDALLEFEDLGEAPR